MQVCLHSVQDRMHQEHLVECLAFSSCAINGSCYDTAFVAGETWGNSEEVGWVRLAVLDWGMSKERLN